jgi:hypothetical protein
LLQNIKPFEWVWPELLKVFRKPPMDISTQMYGGGRDTMAINQRKPSKNTAFSVHFVIKGAEKRRSMAYAKAKILQSELGVAPHLVSVK